MGKPDAARAEKWKRLGELATQASSDKAAWDKLYNDLYTFIVRYPGSRRYHLPEDVLMDWASFVYLTCRKALTQYRGDHQASYFTFVNNTVLKTRFNSWLTQRSRTNKEELTWDGQIESSVTMKLPTGLYEAFTRALRELTVRERVAMLLPGLPDKLQEEDLNFLMERSGFNRETLQQRIFASCTGQRRDTDILDLVSPPKSDADRTAEGVKKRINNLQAARQVAKQKLQNLLGTPEQWEDLEP